MKSKPTPHTHTSVTAKEITTTFGATGGPQWTVTVPAGTHCRKLEGGSDPWVVSNLSFIADKDSMLYWDADHYGIRIPEEKLTDVRAVENWLFAVVINASPRCSIGAAGHVLQAGFLAVLTRSGEIFSPERPLPFSIAPLGMTFGRHS